MADSPASPQNRAAVPAARRPRRQVALVAPWYPSRQLPFRGAFIRHMVQVAAPRCDDFTVYHCDEWATAATEEEYEAIWRSQLALLPHAAQGARTAAGARLVRVPVPQRIGDGYADFAERHEQALRAVLGGRPIPAPVVHAQIGMPGGWAAIRNARPDARVYVTEQATFLDLILQQPRAREMYDEVLDRCAGFFAVGEKVREPLAEAFPHHAGKLGLIANPVDFSESRKRPVTELRRWIYVGGLIPRKGVSWLLEAFAECRAEDPTLSLTYVGEGELMEPLKARAAELGVAEAVTFTGSVVPDEVPRVMREHDLLVHPSRLETFGVTVVEAVAAGMAVLVTRCGGPEETLAEVADDVAEFIDVEESAEPIVTGYRRLRDRFPDRMDLQRGRDRAARRFSFPAVAESYERIWFSDGSSPTPADLSVAHA